MAVYVLKGHDFSRAVNDQKKPGFSVCVRTPLALCNGVLVLSFSEPATPVGVFLFQAARMTCSRVMLNARVARVNSLFTFFSPRVRNCLIPRCCFRTPKTGSTTALRRA